MGMSWKPSSRAWACSLADFCIRNFILGQEAIFKRLRGFSAMLERECFRSGRTPSLRIPMSQPSIPGPLQPGRVSLHKWDIVGKTSAMHQTGRQRNPNSRNHRERRDYSHAVRTRETTVFLLMAVPQA